MNAHARVPFSARAEIPFRLQETFSDFQARLAGLKILARFENTGLGFSARAELRPGLNPSHVIDNLVFIRSDEGLTLETSAFQSLYGGQFTSSTLLINQIFVVFRGFVSDVWLKYQPVSRAEISARDEIRHAIRPLLLTGDLYHNYLHGIAERTNDVISEL